jgi:RimJ/RimL family protein N-acetyltransferase
LLAEYAASDNSVYLVAEMDNRLVGSLSCTGGKRRATRHSADFGMSVAREWRNQGIGTALLRRLIEWAEGTNVIRRLELEVYAHNAPALHLYQKFGFIEEGRRRRGYFQHGRFIDGILMARLL